MYNRQKRISLRVRVFLVTALASIIPLLITVTYLHYDFINIFEEQLGDQLRDISLWVSEDHEVISAYSSPLPEANLNVVAEDVRKRTGAYVIFVDRSGINLSHPNQSFIGSVFGGTDIGPVLKGQTYVTRGVGYAGPAIRAFAPIYVNGQQAGAVVVGFSTPDISHILSRLFRSLYLVIPFALVIIVLLSMLLANTIKRRLFGMEPSEIAARLLERDTILHSVKEGIITVNTELKVTVVNPTAEAYFPSEEKLVGKSLEGLIPHSLVSKVISNKEAQFDRQLSINGKPMLANALPLIIKQEVIGALITFRPLTELNRIAEELTGVNRLVGALRARTHEFQNKLHVISGLLRLKRFSEAEKYISDVAEYEDSHANFITENIHYSAIAGLIIGKLSEAGEKHIEFQVDPSSELHLLPPYFDEHALVVVLGNLVENAFDAVYETDLPLVHLLIKQDKSTILISVSDNGPGIDAEVQSQIFEPGITTKPEGHGWGLANVKERIEIAGGTISFQSNKYGTTFDVVIPLNNQ